MSYIKKRLQNRSILLEKAYPFIVTAIFLAITIILIYRHEFWRDEIQAWLIGSESSSIVEFVNNMRDSQGHPYLWSAILYFISHFLIDNIESMKIIHITISTSVVFLFLKYAPFNKLIKILFTFGYFIFYEYSIISRNYAIGILCIIIFCILYKHKYKNLIPISIVLFFMGQANIYSLFISMVLFLMLVIEFITDRKYIKKNVSKTSIIIAIVIVIAEILFVYWQLRSQAISNIWGSTIFSLFDKSVYEYKESLKDVLQGVVKAYIPIPQFILNFWETNLVVTLLSKYRFVYTFVFSLVLLVIPIFIIKRRTILLYFLGTIGIISIPYFIYDGFVRHFGHLFILFIACLWISNIYEEEYYLIKSRNIFFKLFSNAILIIFLVFSLIGALVAFFYDYKYPFSNGKYVAQYIEENFNKDAITIIGYQDYASETVSTYLDKEIYKPQTGLFGKLMKWENRYAEMSYEDIFNKAYSFTRDFEKVLVIIDKYHAEESEIPENYFFKKQNIKFDDAIVLTEDFYLYLFDKDLVLKSSNLIFKIDESNFNNYWKVLQQCEFAKTDDATEIKVYGNDPYFESTFPMEFKEDNPLVIYISINSKVNSKLQVYYGRDGIGYRESDSQIFQIDKGDNDIYIKVPYSKDLEHVRIDPTNVNSNCIIKGIEIYDFND